MDEEYKNFVFYQSWVKYLVKRKDRERAKEILWQIMRVGSGLDFDTDDEDIIDLVEGFVLDNIKAAQRKYEVATENGSKGGRPRLDIDMERVAELKRQGKTNEEIGRIVGASKTTIQTRWTHYQEEQKHKNQERKETETEKEKKINHDKEKDIDFEKEDNNFLTARGGKTAPLENKYFPVAEEYKNVTYKAKPNNKKQVAFDFSDILSQEEPEKDTCIIDDNARMKEIMKKTGL